MLERNYVEIIEEKFNIFLNQKECKDSSLLTFEFQFYENDIKNESSYIGRFFLTHFAHNCGVHIISSLTSDKKYVEKLLEIAEFMCSFYYKKTMVLYSLQKNNQLILKENLIKRGFKEAKELEFLNLNSGNEISFYFKKVR